MVQTPRHFRDSSNSRIGTYEAFLDLLTLLCFVFIFAAVISLDRYSAAQAAGPSEISSVEAIRGASPAILNRGDVQLNLERSEGNELLTVMDSVAVRTNQFKVDRAQISVNLESIRSSLNSATNIAIAVFDGNEDSQSVSADIIVALQRWLTYNGYGQYKFYFVRKQ